MADDLWVAVLSISERTATKIATLHGVDADEVRDSVQCITGLEYTWDDHPERGLRAIVRVRIRNRWHLVVLYPTADPLGDTYRLGSAYPDD